MGLFEQELQVLNVGLASFADEIVQAGGKATRIEWTPPAGGDAPPGWRWRALSTTPRSKRQTAEHLPPIWTPNRSSWELGSPTMSFPA